MENLQITAAVGIISDKDDPNRFVAVKNKRGWDIPGGHVQNGESPEDAIKREIQEESQYTFVTDPVNLGVLVNQEDPSTGIMVYYGVGHAEEFVPSEEIAERGLFSEDELIDKYFGDKVLLEEIFSILKKDKGE